MGQLWIGSDVSFCSHRFKSGLKNVLKCANKGKLHLIRYWTWQTYGLGTLNPSKDTPKGTNTPYRLVLSEQRRLIGVREQR